MAILGNLIARSLKLRKQFTLPVAPPQVYQRHTLRQLLERGQYTSFGKHYGFGDILSKEIDLVKAFRERVPVHTYSDMHTQWWHRCQQGEENVSWPGKVKYFALSSGTSEAASKHIPVTQDMIRSIKKVGFKQMYTMATNYKIKGATFGKGLLMLGGTTSLFERGDYYEGDMSGISAKNMPRWISSLFYKPGQKISRRTQWEDRIKMIVENAPSWDVGIICGVPAWVQIVLEKIIARYGVKHIHEIWPNLNVYIHGGVALEPYKQSFKKIFGKPVTYIETYMASEGSFGFQARPGGGIKLVLNASIFYEFVPFNSDNFDEDGNIKPNPVAYTVNEVQEGVDYAVLLSTCAGAWRYMIGDVIRFTSAAEYEIAISGRTRQFLSLCGEHLSVDNMNRAIETVSKKMNITIREFTVSGMKYENLFAHQWYIGCDTPVDAHELRKLLDETLCELNDDYQVERESALKEVFVKVLPSATFLDYMKARGKAGAMSKFPRVLKGQQLQDWEAFLSKQKLKEAITV